MAMNLTDAIYKIEYRLAGEETYKLIYDAEDLCDHNELSLYLTPIIKLYDYCIEFDGREIEFDEIEVMLSYTIIFNFESLDIVNETCSYSVNVEFNSAHYYGAILNERGLTESLNTQIEADIREGRKIVLEEPEFKVILDRLR